MMYTENHNVLGYDEFQSKSMDILATIFFHDESKATSHLSRTESAGREMGSKTISKASAASSKPEHEVGLVAR